MSRKVDRTKIGTIEELVTVIVAEKPKSQKLTPGVQTYTQNHTKEGAMLSWIPEAEFHHMPEAGLTRLGTVGDGNCLLHSILFLTSPSYRRYDEDSRSYIAREFRKVLIAREDELRDIFSDIFVVVMANLGVGPDFYEYLFDTLRDAGRGRRPPSELDMDMGMAVARLFGYNLVGVHIDTMGVSQPVCTTMVGHNPELPTLFVHYIGGKVNVSGGKATAGSVSGHYEAIVKASFDEIPPMSSGGETKYVLDEAKTLFVFDEASREFSDFIAHFFPKCEDTTGIYMPPAPLVRGAAAGAGARGTSSGSRKSRKSHISVSSGSHISVSSGSKKASSPSVVDLSNLPLEGGARRRRTQKRRAKKTLRH